MRKKVLGNDDLKDKAIAKFKNPDGLNYIDAKDLFWDIQKENGRVEPSNYKDEDAVPGDFIINERGGVRYLPEDDADAELILNYFKTAQGYTSAWKVDENGEHTGGNLRPEDANNPLTEVTSTYGSGSGEVVVTIISNNAEITQNDNGYLYSSADVVYFSVNGNDLVYTYNAKNSQIYYSGDYSIASVGLLADGEVTLIDANGIRKTGDILSASHVGSGNASFDSDNTGILLDTSFQNANNAYFFDGGFAFQDVEVLTVTIDQEGPVTYIISNANNLSYDGNQIQISHADSVIIGDRVVAINSQNISIPFNYNYDIFNFHIDLDNYQEILVQKSEMVKIDNIDYWDLINSRFIMDRDNLVFANISTINNKHLYNFINPINYGYSPDLKSSPASFSS